MTIARGIVINIHHHGATVRLVDGSLATISLAELVSHRPAYAASLAKRGPLDLVLDRSGRHRSAALAGGTSAPMRVGEVAVATVPFEDIAFEARIGAYLKATQEWAPPDQAPPAERHEMRKKRRARLFEARGDTP